MPIYEYNCKKCGKHFEIVQKITDRPEAKCPDCGSPSKRLISQTGFVLKGGGWYKDGYGSGKKSESGTKQETVKPEVKKQEPKKDK